MQEGQHGRIEAGDFEVEEVEGQDDKLLPVRCDVSLPTVPASPYVPLDLVDRLPSLRVELELRVYAMKIAFRSDVSRPAVLVSPYLLSGLFFPFLPIVLVLLLYAVKIPQHQLSRELSRPSGLELPWLPGFWKIFASGRNVGC